MRRAPSTASTSRVVRPPTEMLIASISSCIENELSTTMPNKSACAANAHVKKEDACAETNMYLSEGRSANLGTIRSADGTITMQILSDDNAKPTVETADINSHIFRNMNLSAKK